MKLLADKTGLKVSQVYKWHWDQKKKEQDEAEALQAKYPYKLFEVTNKHGKIINSSINCFKVERSPCKNL